MKVYVDLVIVLNAWLDFLLLLTLAFVLKRNVSLKRIFFASIIGSLFSIILFFSFSKICKIMLRLIICLLMLLFSFSYKNIKYTIENVTYFYLISIILAGFIYLVKDYYSFDNFKSNFIMLSTLTPLILYIYLKKTNKIQKHYNHIHKVELFYKGNKYSFNAYLDTGNKLYDPYKRRPVILVHTDEIKYDYENGILVPCTTAIGENLLKCLKADKIIIDDDIERHNVIFALSQDSFKIDDVNMILHEDLIGG